MDNDIVTRLAVDIASRLRLQSKALSTHRLGDLVDDMYGEAADEIERLRAVADRLADALRRCEKEPTSPKSWSNAFDALKAYEEMRHG